MDIETRTFVGKPLTGITPYIEWAGDDSLVYITMDKILRPDKVTISATQLMFIFKAWLHKLDTDQSNDLCLYHEKDDTFSLDQLLKASSIYLSDEFNNSELLACPVDNANETTVLLPHRERAQIHSHVRRKRKIILQSRIRMVPSSVWQRRKGLEKERELKKHLARCESGDPDPVVKISRGACCSTHYL